MRKLRSYEGTPPETSAKTKQQWRGRLTGLAASPGFGRGQAFVLEPRMELSAIKKKKSRNPKHEIERFRGAVERGIDQINVIKKRMSELISAEEGAIFDVYRLILEDPQIIHQIEQPDSQRRLHRGVCRAGGLRALHGIHRQDRQ